MEEAIGSALPRRSLLRSLVAIGATAGLAQPNPPEAHLHEHGASSLVDSAEDAKKAPLYFSAGQYSTLCALCQLIIPVTGNSGGAVEAGVPAFIDLLTSENRDYQRRLSGGLSWLDALSTKRFGNAFVHCSDIQQKSLLDQIAYRAAAASEATLTPGADFFAFLRDLVLDGFFTSKVGIEYLQFEGNKALASFPGCPQPQS